MGEEEGEWRGRGVTGEGEEEREGVFTEGLATAKCSLMTMS